MTIWYTPETKMPEPGELVLCVFEDIQELDQTLDPTQTYWKVYLGRGEWSLSLKEEWMDRNDINTVNALAFKNLSLKGGAIPKLWCHVYGTS